MGVDPGGMGGGVYPPNIYVGGWPVLSSPPPPIFHGSMSYHTDKISEVPTKIMKEIAGFECRNAPIHRLSRCGRVAGSL